MNEKMTFALLLYVNVFYFILYACFETCLLISKWLTLNDSRYTLAPFLNEFFILAFMVIVESLRLYLGQQNEPTDFDKRMSAIFQILVLTLPSIYSVSYFTFWQNKITSLDFALGLVMLGIQVAQCLSAVRLLWPKVKWRDFGVLFSSSSNSQQYTKLNSPQRHQS